MTALLLSWPFWVSLALIITIGYVLVAKPVKTSQPAGRDFSNPIHTHLLFKIGCLLVLGFVLAMTIPAMLAIVEAN